MILPKVILSAGDGARAEVYVHGAHVTSWIPARGEERLFLSSLSAFGPGAAIRGGVPVVFPQFSTFGPLPKHGFARTSEWAVVNSDNDRATFRLTDSAETRAIWPHAFVAELTVVVGGNTLELQLGIQNSGSDRFEFTAALHTYLRVDDVGQVLVHGLGQARYRDSAAGGTERVQDERELAIVGEVDRIYLDAPRAIEVRGAAQSARIAATGFRDVVVWNPGPRLSATIPDMEPDGYRRMLCVEAGAIGVPVSVLPGGVWTGTQLITSGNNDI